MHDTRFTSLVICGSETKHGMIQNNIQSFLTFRTSLLVGDLLEISSISPVEAGNVSTGVCEILPASCWCLR